MKVIKLCLVDYLFTPEDRFDTMNNDRPLGIPCIANSMPGLISKQVSTENLNSYVNIYNLIADAKRNEDITHILELGLSVNSYLDDGPMLKKLVETIVEYKNIHLLFSCGWDMYSSRVYNECESTYTPIHDRTKVIKQQLSSVNNKRLHFWLGNTTEVKIHKKAFPGADVQYYSVYPNRLISQHVKSKLKLYVAPGGEIYRRKIFVCLNNYEKEHRTAMVRFIRSQPKLMSQTYLSYLKPHDLDLCILADGDHVQHQIGDWQDIIHTDVVDGCYTYIATETHWQQDFRFGHSVFPPKNNTTIFETSTEEWILHQMGMPFSGWISEKSLKSAYYELPLLSVGYAGSLQAFKDLGFKTFPEFFDETYDSTAHPGERMRMIQENISRLADLPIEQIHQLYHSAGVQAKLKHNKARFMALANTDPYLFVVKNTGRYEQMQEFYYS